MLCASTVYEGQGIDANQAHTGSSFQLKSNHQQDCLASTLLSIYIPFALRPSHSFLSALQSLSCMHDEQARGLLSLPRDALLEVLKWCELKDICRLEQVCVTLVPQSTLSS